MATQVTMEDGTESPLVDHIRDAHQKGTRGYTEEYLDTMHRALHQRKREPEEELEHRHPDATGGGDGADSQHQWSSGAMDSRHRDREAFTPEAANNKHRDREEQEMSGIMKSKHRDRDGQRTGQDMNGQHRDRYAQRTPEVPGQRTGQPQEQGTPENMKGMPEDMNGDHREHEDQLVSAGGRQRTGKHRKQRH